MEPADLDSLQSAVAGLNDDEIDRLMGLMSDDIQWTGVPYGWLWRRRTPS